MKRKSLIIIFVAVLFTAFFTCNFITVKADGQKDVEKELNENLPLPSKILRAVGSATLEGAPNKQNHTFVIDNEEDLADVMTRILKGEFE